MRLLLSHMAMQSKRLLHAMICEQLDAEEALQRGDLGLDTSPETSHNASHGTSHAASRGTSHHP